MKKVYLPLIFGLILFAGCKSTSKTAAVYEPAPDAVPIEEELLTEQRQLDTMVISAPRVDEAVTEVPETFELEKYNPSHNRINDLLHSKLELAFDWENEQVLGKATLRFSPYFYPTQELVLDAKNFTIHELSIPGSNTDVSYEYDGKQIKIELDKAYGKGETYEVFIDYTASPSQTGGSSAITSDQGLFFINPREEEPNKPRQIWTQGETEWNSKWFPTIDKPNERCTQEMYLTVEDEFKTLSNGVLVNSTKNSDGTRTDYWKMDQPHAPYLFMIAVGDFAVVSDEWEGIPVDYYVEPEYESSARAIFSNTVEMLDFFSEKTGLKYPWPKYAQIVVRDYVSGAMENTTSVIYGDFVQKTEVELIDNHNERIVAHELFHHWFGDYVTCESWANLTMNEGFANYSEYLWFEHKYGVDEADYHLYTEQSGYISSTRNSVHPLIHFSYEDKEDMFDAHSYNKGGAVLHMLRDYVGDEAFWAALNKYLTEHAYESVEVHDLRLAFEETTGEDLNWFFNQWYLSEGHPTLDITYGYDADRKVATVEVVQTQDPTMMLPIFKLPVAIDVYLEDQAPPVRHEVWVDEREEVFEFPVEGRPKLINFDANRMLLAEVTDNKTEEELIFQYRNGKKLMDRLEAVSVMRESEQGVPVLKAALQDDYWVVRAIALQSIQEYEEEDMPVLRAMASEDEKSTIRAFALSKLGDAEDEKAATIAKAALKKEKAYNTLSAALYALFLTEREQALQEAARFNDSESSEIQELLSVIYSESGDTKYLNYFEERLKNQDGFSAYYFYKSYQNLAKEGDFETAMQAMENLKAIATNMETSSLNRLYATVTINEMRNYYRSEANASDQETDKAAFETQVEKITTMIDEIRSIETSEDLLQTYKTRLKLVEKE